MFPYEKLEVYRKATNLNKTIVTILKSNKSMPGYLKNQLGRAALSIQLNLAEGSGRQTDKDRKNFLVNSRGSAFECAAIIQFLFEIKEINQEVRNELYGGFDEVSRILYVMITNIEKRQSLK